MLKTIVDYQSPHASELQQLKKQLGYSAEQMADLLGVSGGNQWRKYTGGKQARNLGAHYLFFLAARLSLTDNELERIFNTMRELGGSFAFKERPSVD